MCWPNTSGETETDGDGFRLGGRRWQRDPLFRGEGPMKQTTYALICGSVFLVVAAGHLTRLLFGWDVVIAGWRAPHWISIPGLIVPGALSVWGFTLAARGRTHTAR